MFDPKTRVLIVDDMSMMRKLLSKICKDLGLTDFTEAADGDEAWKALNSASEPIGLVISDWNMPNCTGVDLLQKMREHTNFKDLPFLMVTAEGEQSLVDQAIATGADGVVTKPFTRDSITEKLNVIHSKRCNMAG